MARPPWPIIPRVDWDEYNAEHLALHGVLPWEVEEMLAEGDFFVRPHKKRRKDPKYQRRYLLTGRTLGGRALVVVVDFIPPDTLRPVTAYDER